MMTATGVAGWLPMLRTRIRHHVVLAGATTEGDVVVVVDVSGERRGDLYRQGREIARIWTGDPDGFHPNLPFTWGAQPHNGLIYFNDINSGIWIMKLGEMIDKGSTTAPGL